MFVLGAFGGVSTKNINGSELCSIIGYADSKIDNVDFRTYIFFNLRLILRK